VTETTTGAFPSTSHAGPAWDLAREQLARPRIDDAPIEGFREGMAVRDLIARYAYAIDRGDIDDLMRFFTDDCVISGPRGTLSGAEEIRAHYEELFVEVPRRFHLWANVVVRMGADFREGRVSSYFYAMLGPKDGPPHSIGGLSVDHVVKRAGRWQIRERSINFDVTAALAPREAGP
jgi:ketosteroid isomerase-like protein